MFSIFKRKSNVQVKRPLEGSTYTYSNKDKTNPYNGMIGIVHHEDDPNFFSIRTETSWLVGIDVRNVDNLLTN